MNRFPDVLKYRQVALCSAKDIIECSFIVQNSLSYLNLELCKLCFTFGKTTLSYNSRRHYDGGFVSTQEKCRKKFDRNRYLLYSLHLDIPVERNVNLKLGPGSDKMVPELELLPVGKLAVYKHYYRFILSGFIDYVFKYTDSKLRLTKWLLRLDDAKEFKFSLLSAEVTNFFVDLLYPKFVDSELMSQFLLKCNLGEWLETYEKPDILEGLLYHAHRYGRRNIDNRDQDDGYPDLCILRQTFANVAPLLKYKHAPSYFSSIYKFYINATKYYGKYLGLTAEILRKPESWMGKQRYCLLLQILLIYLTKSKDTPNALEALRLLWCTYSDPYITLEEMEKAFGDVLDSELINDIYQFYADCIDEATDVVQPRSLKHLCRNKIRKILWLNQNWLPEGIAGTGLPSQLQAFLNLEKVTMYRVAIADGNGVLQNEDMELSVY